MSRHPRRSLCPGNINQLLALPDEAAIGFSIKVCLPDTRLGLGHREMRFDGCGDDDRVEANAVKHVIV